MSELTNPTGTISSYQLMRWARQARTALMASYLQSVAIYLATSLGDCARYFGKLARRAAHELYLQNATRTLQQFDDRILADIGLRRAEIEHAVRQRPVGNAKDGPKSAEESATSRCLNRRALNRWAGSTSEDRDRFAMNIQVSPQKLASREQVIALHCSGANASQWRCLVEALGPGYEVLTPEHYGCESSGPWTGEHAFTLADDAARPIALIDESDRKVHLVGHSYGGGVALYVALNRPNRIATMTLYEPSAFHLLRQMGQAGAKAFAEISAVARRLGQCVIDGDYRAGVADFVDYWSYPGAWNAMRLELQKALMLWAPRDHWISARFLRIRHPGKLIVCSTFRCSSCAASTRHCPLA